MSSVHRYIEGRESLLVRGLQDMVRIGTVNPPGLDYRAMVEHLSVRCQGLGMRNKVHRVPDGEVRRIIGSSEYPRYNMIARWDVGRERTVHFNAHYDVVPFSGQWKFGDPFEPGIVAGAVTLLIINGLRGKN